MQTRSLVCQSLMLLGLTLGIPGCGGAEDADGSNDRGTRFSVVATTGMIGDVARNIGGERAAVRVLMTEGTDPHLYKPTRDDVAAVNRADVVLYNGLLLEGKMSDVFARVAADGPNRRLVAVAERLDPQRLLEGGEDPHVWMDPALWADVARVVADEFAAHDPDHAADYAAAADVYVAQLEALRGYGEDVLASIPDEQRVLVTSHDAFGYFGNAFGLRVEGVQGLSTESEAGLRRVNDLADLVATLRLPAVFVESSVSDQGIQALVNGVRSRGHTVVIGGMLYGDAMGAAGTYEGTYIGMMDHNLTTVAQALGGNVPEGGFRGRTQRDAVVE